MFLGPMIDDLEVLAQVPADYRLLLEVVNGYVAYSGGLHVRGACRVPAWHSLREAWFGEDAIHRLFSAVRPSDVPFAQDPLGDQFLLRDGIVWKLRSESGDLSSMSMTLSAFDAACRAGPSEFLELAPLYEFQSQGGVLKPGELLSVYPPFISKESANGVRYRAISASERLRSLSNLAKALDGVPDGAQVSLTPSR